MKRQIIFMLAALLFGPTGANSRNDRPAGKAVQEVAGPDYKRPDWCSAAEKGADCLIASGSTVDGVSGNTIGYDEIRLADGCRKIVVTCDDYTGKPSPCWTAPPPHPETLSECLLRRYRAYESAFMSYVNPSGRGMSRGYTEQEKQEFIRTLAALDEAGKTECKGKPVQ